MKVAAAAAALALLAAGCGSDKSSEDSSATDWANGLCSAITTYRDSVTDAANSFKDNVSREGLGDAAKQVRDATDSFLEETKSLGKPNTEAGDQAKDALDTLSNQLNTDLDSIKAANGTGLVQSLSTVTGALATAQTQVQSALSQLEGLDAQGELGDAFEQASACESLR